MYAEAEMLRLNFWRVRGIDLQKESLKGDNEPTDTATKEPNNPSAEQ
jgi:hypothetical protein